MREEIIEVIFTEEDKLLKIFELSNFLYHIKVLYSLLATSEEFLRCGEEREPERTINVAKDISQTIYQRGGYRTYYERHNLFRKDLKDKDVFIAKIHKESPLTIWFMGISALLVASFILCGGELEITTIPPRIRIKIPSLGEGIKRLKEAIRK